MIVCGLCLKGEWVRQNLVEVIISWMNLFFVIIMPTLTPCNITSVDYGYLLWISMLEIQTWD